MSSTLDTPMNRSMAMAVNLAYAAQLERAKELEQRYPEYCWVSDVSTVRDSNNLPLLCLRDRETGKRCDDVRLGTRKK